MERKEVVECLFDSNLWRDEQSNFTQPPYSHERPFAAWMMLMRGYMARAEAAWLKGDSASPEVCRNLQRVTALGIACFEQYGISEFFNED